MITLELRWILQKIYKKFEKELRVMFWLIILIQIAGA